jgi:hypothetical protein
MRVLSRAVIRQRLLLDLESQLPELASLFELPESAVIAARKLVTDLRAYIYANLIWIGKTRRYDLGLPRIKGSFDDVITSDNYQSSFQLIAEG